MGQLAAGVAHEIKNPLTAVKGFLQLLGHSSHDKQKEFVEIMQNEINRIDFIANEMLLLAKPQVVNFQFHDPKMILESVVTLLEIQATMHNVQIITDFAEHLSPIRCEENQLKQVFVNITKNVIEAMSHGGDLVIRLKEINEKILVQFIDQGCGIPVECIMKLGEPFYTTKEKGTGLGLMVKL